MGHIRGLTALELSLEFVLTGGGAVPALVSKLILTLEDPPLCPL
jgi:hypothetical protein